MPFSFGSKTGGAADKDGNVFFEVKIFVGTFTLLSYPVAICTLFCYKPSVAYWFGNTTFKIAEGIVIWTAIMYFLVILKFFKKGMALVLMLILPSAVLGVACQLQEVNFRSVAAELEAPDCEASMQKANLQKALIAAEVFFDNCTKTLAMAAPEGGDLNVEQAKMVTPMWTCPGYKQEVKTYGRDWNYIQELEELYRCGGWCYPQRPLWTYSPTPLDSCALVAGRAMSRSISRLGMQVAVYSGLVMLSVSFILIFTDFFEEPHTKNYYF